MSAQTFLEQLDELIDRAKYYGEYAEALPVFEALRRKLTEGAHHADAVTRDVILMENYRRDRESRQQ